jgi:hypothetical protein
MTKISTKAEIKTPKFGTVYYLPTTPVLEFVWVDSGRDKSFLEMGLVFLSQKVAEEEYNLRLNR